MSKEKVLIIMAAAFSTAFLLALFGGLFSDVLLSVAFVMLFAATSTAAITIVVHIARLCWLEVERTSKEGK